LANTKHSTNQPIDQPFNQPPIQSINRPTNRYSSKLQGGFRRTPEGEIDFRDDFFSKGESCHGLES